MVDVVKRKSQERVGMPKKNKKAVFPSKFLKKVSKDFLKNGYLLWW